MTVDQINDIIDLIADGVPNTALKVRNALKALSVGTGVTGDVKEIDVSNAYLLANFDPTGLGINERLGWAICNGNNGTRNRGGRVPMQYNATYPTLGATGGSADAVVVSHTHALTQIKAYNNVFGVNGFYDRSNGAVGVGLTTDSAGESGANKNMQPYIVTLFIQKL